ncbi:MAG: hypothetical protein CVV03_00260 [Firmicutes bacterium HGW-Firmicutes-8]|nr:MAG: hypothetical protein CVV03_00260 [Firmicutes bacterium HGW-Firmicutes-8]
MPGFWIERKINSLEDSCQNDSMNEPEPKNDKEGKTVTNLLQGRVTCLSNLKNFKISEKEEGIF